ncbi:MAG: acetate--CoA ligase family protein [Usitatibacter sp.]
MSARPKVDAINAGAGFANLLNPRSITIIGASSDEAGINGQVLRNLQARNYPGALYPVNPKYPEVGGIRCYPSVESLPHVPDLAIVLLGAARAVQAVEECGRKGVPFAIVIGAGFAEMRGEGEKLQQQLLEAARRHGVRLVGPNCIGLMNVPDNVFAGFGPVFGLSNLRAGSVSMVTQSGGFGFAVVNMAEEQGVGFRHVVSTGNEADLTSLDFMDAFIDDPGTTMIAGYFEGIKDAHRLPAIARRALDAKKPVIAWKVGNSPEGERAAASHTGNLGGSAQLYKAAFDQFGWIRIDDVHELVDCAAAFARDKLPGHDGVGIVTVSGGAGVLLADACAARGLGVPELSEATRARLREVLPAYASPQNPVDVTASILNDSGLLRAALKVILDDPAIASLIVVASSVEGAAAEKIAAELAALDAETHKPLMVSWSSREDRVGRAYELLREARVPLYRTPSRCCGALAALCRFAEALRRHHRDAARPARVAPRAAQAPITAANEYEAKQLLARYGLTPTQEVLATNAAEAAAAAAKIGYPVALKIQSADIPHKTEAGGVRLHVPNSQAVRAEYDEIIASARAHAPEAMIDGVLVQEMVEGGVEVILGAVNDSRFGPAVMFGLGGIFTEVLEDVVFRFAPISLEAAHEMINSIRGVAVLTGARGRAPADVDALANAIVAVSQLLEDHGSQIAELDINPLVVLPKGRGVRVVDALIAMRAEPPLTN